MSIDDLRDAFEGAGKEPIAHQRALQRLKSEWPSLWAAIVGLVYADAAPDAPSPPADAEGVLVDDVRSFLEHSVGIWEGIADNEAHYFHAVAPYYLDAFGTILSFLGEEA